MRLRNKRESIAAPEPPQPVVASDSDVVATAQVPWSVEQLNALGPVTGPSHRTFVPIVRATLADTSHGDLTDSGAPPLLGE
jgi:hypothetical protein